MILSDIGLGATLKNNLQSKGLVSIDFKNQEIK